MKNEIALLLLSLIILVSCQKEMDDSADTIYFGGDILTMEGNHPKYVQAVAVKKGEIIFAGSIDQIEKFQGHKTEMKDIKGKTMLPGFIDAHGHLWNAGFQALSANLLPAPDGACNDIDAIISLLNNWKSSNKNVIGKYGWIIGSGYDDAQLKEKLPPTADDLDKVSTEIPVMIIHQSGHLAVLNHKALEIAGYNSLSENPAGGVIRRKEGTTEPNGVLEEMAMFIPLFKMMAALDHQANEKIAEAGLKSYVRFGFTTAQEGRATRDVCDTWLKLANNNKLVIDVAAYPDIQTQMTYLKKNGIQNKYKNHFRIAGVKLSLDGSPQGKTAWLTKPYINPPPGQLKTYAGYPAFSKESDAAALVDSAYKNNWQILAHCNGDAAIDQYIRAVRHAAKLYGKKTGVPLPYMHKPYVLTS
nr:amidohydrolase family protein [Flavobacterium sp. Root935]